MWTTEQAWDLVIENDAVIAKAIDKSPRIGGIQAKELQSYAYEAAFRAARTWEPSLGKIESRLYVAAQTGAIDGLRDMGRFYGWRRTRPKKWSIQSYPGDDVEFWEHVSDEASTDAVLDYLSFMEIVEPLTERQRQIAFLYYSERWTPTEIGEYLGVTGSAIVRARDHLVAKLRDQLDLQGLGVL